MLSLSLSFPSLSLPLSPAQSLFSRSRVLGGGGGNDVCHPHPLCTPPLQSRYSYLEHQGTRTWGLRWSGVGVVVKGSPGHLSLLTFRWCDAPTGPPPPPVSPPPPVTLCHPLSPSVTPQVNPRRLTLISLAIPISASCSVSGLSS